MSFNKFTFFSSLIATGCLTGYLPIFERNENVDFIFNGLTRGWRSVVTGYKIINNYTNVNFFINKLKELNKNKGRD